MAGYGVPGLTFETGHVLAFRCFTASSIGPPYLSIWHRHPDGRWVIHTNVEPDRACPRYFGPALHGCQADDIEIAWKAGGELSIAAARARLHIALRLAGTPLTKLLGAASRAAPRVLLQHRRAGPLAGRILDAGEMTLAGIAPSGHLFSLRPRSLWRVEAAAAVVGGRDAGSVVRPAIQPALGEFLVPRRGLFAAGRVEFTPPPRAPRTPR